LVSPLSTGWGRVREEQQSNAVVGVSSDGSGGGISGPANVVDDACRCWRWVGR